MVCLKCDTNCLSNPLCSTPLFIGLANATFNSYAAIEFTTNTSVTRTLSSLQVDFRTRDEDAVLLRAVEEVDSDRKSVV